MLLPLIVLATAAIFVGYIGVPDALSPVHIKNHFDEFIRPSVEDPTLHGDDGGDAGTPASLIRSFEEGPLERRLAVVSTLVALIGLGFGWIWFKRKPLWKPPQLLENKYYVDEVYDAAVVQPIKQASRGVLWKFIDVRIIDGAVNGAGLLAGLLGSAMRYLQSGLARSYVAVLVLGALLIIGYFVIK